MLLRAWCCVLLLATALRACAEEPAHAWPLWDGKETTAEYAQRVNLPPTKTLDLGNGVTLELVLIPAGQFIMGTPEPEPVDEDAFRKRIVVGQALLAAGAGTLLVMLAVVVIQAVRRKGWPQVSLRRLLLLTAVAGMGLYGGIHWRQAAQDLRQGQFEFLMAEVRYWDASVSEKPAHPVTLTKPFYMGKYEATQAQYLQILGHNPSRFQGPTNPVEFVTWEDASEFCKQASVASKETVRLPTEAEWEYACRAGTQTVYSSGDQAADLDRVAWHHGNSKRSTHPVGEKAPNGFGLYDMHGNLWEWCSDWYADTYYATSPSDDPQGPAIGKERVVRGGSWSNPPRACRAAYRLCGYPEMHDSAVGFRVVVEVSSRAP